MKPASTLLLCAVSISWGLASLCAGQAPASLDTVPDNGRSHPEKSLSEPAAEEKLRRWTLVPSASYSFFNKGRDSWQEEDVQVFCQLNRHWSLGAEVDVRHRPPSGTDIYYSALVSYAPTDAVELHAKASVCSDPRFSANEVYSAGVRYQVLPRLALLLDYEGMNYDEGQVDQAEPGVTLGLTEEVSLTLRYNHGWAFSSLEYNYYSGTLDVRLPGERLLALSFSYGTDPDIEFGDGGNPMTGLSPAYTTSLFFRQPLCRDLNLFAGFEYSYRLDRDGDELYQQFTPTVGLAWKF